MKNNHYIPKGSYHTFCRKMYGVEEFQDKPKTTYYKNHRSGQVKSVHTQRANKVQDFNTFQQYMSNLNKNNDQERMQLRKISKTVDGEKNEGFIYPNRTALKQTRAYFSNRDNIQTSRQNRTQTVITKNRSSQVKRRASKREGMDDIIGAFLPYFKIKLEKEAQNIKQPKDFKIDNRKFKLKSLLIEENKFISQKWAPMV